MTKKKVAQEPINIITGDCSIRIRGINKTIFKIDWLHIKKRNEEFRISKKNKIQQNLSQYLLDKKIIKDFIQQIKDERIRMEGVHSVWPSWKYYACEPVVDWRNGMAYRIIFFLDDNKPELIGVITVYPTD